MADINSLTAEFSLGIQSAKDTQATKFFTALATLSGIGVAFDTRQPLQEHPSSGGSRSFNNATPTTRTGYLGRARATFLLRPVFLPIALIASGFKCTTSAGPEANTYKHTLIVEDDSLIKWVTAKHNIGDGGSSFDRTALNARGNRLNISATNERVQAELAISSLKQGKLSGSPTYTSEVSDEFSPSIGSLTCTFAAATLVDEIRGLTCEIAHPLKEANTDRPLFTSERTDLARDNIAVSGSIQGVNVTQDLWWKVTGGSAAATAPSLSAALGALTWQFDSAGLIGATATPYSAKFIFPQVQFEFPEDGFSAQNADSVRVDMNYTMITNGVAQPITVEVINGVAQYVA